MNCRDCKYSLCLAGCGLCLCNLFALCIFYGIYKLLVCSCIRQEYLYLHAGIRALDLRCHLNARSAVVVQIKMGLIYRNDIDVTVKSAVECEICILRIYSVVYAILHSDHNQVLFFCELFCDVYTPGGISSVVMCHCLAVHIDVCGSVCSS